MAKTNDSPITKQVPAKRAAKKLHPSYKDLPVKVSVKRKENPVSKEEIKSKHKRKVVLVEEVVDEEQVIKLPSIRLRTTPKQFANVMCSLTPEQRACVTRLGFRSLLGFNIEQLPGNLAYYVVDKFDVNDMVIRTEKGDIKADPQAVLDVFGIQDVGVDINSLEHRSDSLFVQSWLAQFPPDKLTRASSVSDKILSSSETDSIFEMNFIMLFANTMVSCERNGKVSEFVLTRLADDVDISSINWCQFILSSLKYSKTHWDRNNPDSFYNGPATFLTLLYLDRTKFDAFPVVRGRPVFKNWKGAISVRAKKEAGLGSFGMLELASEYDEEAEHGEGFFKLDEEKKDNLVSLEGYCDVIEEKLKKVNDLKQLLSRIINEGLSKYPNEKMLLCYERKMKEVFKMDEGDEKNDDDFEKKPEDDEMKGEDDEKKAESEKKSEDDELKGDDDENKEEKKGDDDENKDEKKGDDDETNAESDENAEEEIRLGSDDPVDPVEEVVVEGEKVADKDVEQDQNAEENASLTQWFDTNVNEVVDICGIISLLYVPTISLSRPPLPVHNTPTLMSLTPPTFHLLSQEDNEEFNESDEAVKMLEKKGLADSSKTDEAEQKLEKKGLADGPKKIQKVYTKRQVRRETVLRSAYVNRMTAVSDILTDSETSVAMELFSMKQNPCEIVFEAKKGACMVHRISLESLCPDIYVESSVIDVWSFILNQEQKYRDPSSPSRFFFPTSVIYSNMYDNKNMKKDAKLKIFQSNVEALFKFYPKQVSFRKVDLVFFPICRQDHFFVLMFDMRVPKLHIIDNSAIVSNFAAKYTKVCNLVQYLFAEHLKIHKHPLANMIEKLKPVQLRMPWRTRDNVVDCGVFAMHHMDRYKATTESDWTDELGAESLEQKNQLRKLRIRFASKIITHDLNLHAEKMLRNALKFSRSHAKEDYRKVVISAKNLRNDRVEQSKNSLQQEK